MLAHLNSMRDMELLLGIEIYQQSHAIVHDALFYPPGSVFLFKVHDSVCLQEGLQVAMPEFKDQQFTVAGDGQPVAKTTSWTGLRYLIAEVSHMQRNTLVIDI